MSKNNQNKILFIVPLPPPVHGSTMMCKYIKDSKSINDEFDCDFVNLSASRTTGEVRKFKLIKIWRFLCTYIIVGWKLIKYRYDLCYIALAFHKSLLKDAPFVLLCKLFRKRVVIHLHGKGATEDAKNVFYRWLLKLTFKNTKVIMLSWLLYPDVEQFVKREDISICPNGIPIVDYECKERNNPIPRLLFLSNLIESKGVIVLLDALKILADKGYSFQCDFVGGETNDIDGKRFSEEVNKRKLNRLVLYHGKKYGKEKDKMFEKADVFVFPTFYENETFGLVNLEAMAYHLPIISTNEGGIPDVVRDGENGLICERNNSESLANCIKQLLDDPELRVRMGEDGNKKLHEAFTDEVFESKMKDIMMSEVGGAILDVCHYIGKKYGDDKEEIFNKSDIFVFPTYYSNECFPLVLLEAMQHGLPIVTTDEGAICDIVENEVNGLLCNKNNAESLANCIEKLISDESLRQTIKNENTRKFEELYRLDKFENNLKLIFRNILIKETNL